MNTRSKKIDEYFKAHPDRNPVPTDLPSSRIIAHLNSDVQRIFFRNFLMPQMKAKAAEGYDSLFAWIKEKLNELGLSDFCDTQIILPHSFNSTYESASDEKIDNL